MVGGEASNKIGKLYAGQATKTALQDGSTEPVWAMIKPNKQTKKLRMCMSETSGLVEW